MWPEAVYSRLTTRLAPAWCQLPALRESILRLFNEGRTTMTTRCAPALLVKPQGVWARGVEVWVGSCDLRNQEFRRWGSSGPTNLMEHGLGPLHSQIVWRRLKCETRARLGCVTPLGWPRSAYKSNVECCFLSWNDGQITLKIKVNDPQFQYQLRESQNANLAQFSDSSSNPNASYHTDKPNFLEL